MNSIDWNVIVTATIGAGILTAMRFIWSWLRSNYMKHDKRTTHLEIQFASMHNGLQSVNHGFGESYKKGYDEKYEELIAANKFIEE